MALADHEGWYAICPEPIEEGNSAHLGVRRSGYEARAVTVFTRNDGHTADSDDYTGYEGVTFEQSEGTTLNVPVDTTEDTKPEINETFEIGFWVEDAWHGCVVTIVDDDEPRIVGVEIVSSPADGFAYRAGDAIDLVVSLDKDVEVEGTPTISLYLSDSDGSTWRGAEYRSGSGTREVVFRYRVKLEDLDLDGLSVSSAATAADRTPAHGFSGTITAAGTDAPIDYAHPGVDSAQSQRVDGRPYARSIRTISSPEFGGNAYRANEVIEFALTFDTPVVVEGETCVTLSLQDDPHNALSATRQADYRNGSGSDTLVFAYTVRPGDTAPGGIALVAGSETSGFCGSGTIKALGTQVERSPWYDGTHLQSGHSIDTTPPAASSIAIISRPDNGEAYAAGEAISVEVAFSEPVIASGGPYIELDIGGDDRRAVLAPGQGPGTSLVFEYEVQSGDHDDDGASISANSLRHDDRGIHDAAGNAARLSHPTVVADPTQRVDTSTGRTGS